jgi:hypothetical protein
MKTRVLAVVLVAVVLAAWPMPARAINKEWSAALGFLGGLMVANAGGCERTVVREQVVVAPPPCPPPVIIREPVYYEEVVEETAACGHWEYRRERSWIPGRWICIRDACGFSQRVWEPARCGFRTVRVWVDDFPPRRHGHRHHR